MMTKSRISIIGEWLKRRAGWRACIAAMVLLPMLALTGHARAELSTSQRTLILSEAQQAYEHGVSLRRDDPDTAREAFREAAARYEQLVDDGIVNGALQYNLANAYLQAGDLGRAMAHYRAALALSPGDAEVRHNLEYARSLRENQIATSGTGAIVDALLSWHRQMSFGLRAGLFVLTYFLFWGVLTLQVRRPAGRWVWTAIGCAILWIPLGVSTGSDVLTPAGGDAGVVIADNVTVRKGNGEGFEPQFRQSLNPGVEFEVLERRPGWMEIELADGKSGWIRTDQAMLVRDAIDGASRMSDNLGRT